MGSLGRQDNLGPSGNCKDFGVASMKGTRRAGRRWEGGYR